MNRGSHGADDATPVAHLVVEGRRGRGRLASVGRSVGTSTGRPTRGQASDRRRSGASAYGSRRVPRLAGRLVASPAAASGTRWPPDAGPLGSHAPNSMPRSCRPCVTRCSRPSAADPPERLVVALRDVLAESMGLPTDGAPSCSTSWASCRPSSGWPSGPRSARTSASRSMSPSDRGAERRRRRSGDGAASSRRGGGVPCRAARTRERRPHAPAAPRPSSWLSRRTCPPVVSDDGPGIPADVARLAIAGGRRGLADMRPNPLLR